MNRIRGVNSPEQTPSVLSVSVSPAPNARPAYSRSSPSICLINEVSHSHKHHNQFGHQFRATMRFAPYVNGKPLITQVQCSWASEQTFAQRNILGVVHFLIEPQSNSGSSDMQATFAFLLCVGCLLISLLRNVTHTGKPLVIICQLHAGISPSERVCEIPRKSSKSRAYPFLAVYQKKCKIGIHTEEELLEGESKQSNRTIGVMERKRHKHWGRNSQIQSAGHHIFTHSMKTTEEGAL